MTKKHFIELADHIRKPGMMPASVEIAIWRATPDNVTEERIEMIKLAVMQAVASELADFCKSQNGAFDRDRWLGYIDGTNGPNGGPVKK